MFDKIKTMKTHHQVIFSIVIAFAVIAFWRGVWGLMDEYFFPNHLQISLWFSVAIGIIILAVTHYVTRELT